jgi:TonB family protein
MKTKKTILCIILFPAIAFGQMVRSNMVSVGKQGDTVQIPIALRQIDLDDHTSLSLVAPDSIKPSVVSIVFAAEDSIGDSCATILNPAGADISLSLKDKSQFLNAVNQKKVVEEYDSIVTSIPQPPVIFVLNQHKIIGIAELSWNDFESFQKLDTIRIVTQCRTINLNDEKREIISDFYFYLAEREEPPPYFVPIDKEPIIIARVDPEYPQLALQSGLEGEVFLNVWVDRKGKVHGPVILKSSNEIFNAPAIKAARQWVFTPAMMEGKSVSVRVAIPFRFRLPKSK